MPIVSHDLPPGEKQRIWSPMSATLISGERRAVLVDPLMTCEQGRTLADWVAGPGQEPDKGQCDRRETMIKLSILMVRRSDLTYEQFIQHWREVHGPLFAAQSESKQYVRRYIQNQRTGDVLPGTVASNFDGIAELWFDDISGAKAFFESDGFRENVIHDEEAFMDRKRCELLYTHEHRVMG
jgi:uncharacterized protein (TIGR02118 family)